MERGSSSSKRPRLFKGGELMAPFSMRREDDDEDDDDDEGHIPSD